jgi:NO-binding membrane sensor protein with MHYT domain
MTADQLDIERLRQLALEQPESGVTRGLALVISLCFLFAVLDLVRRGRLREEYTPIWVAVALGIMGLSVWFDVVRVIARLIGAWTPSSTLYFFGVLFLLVLCLNYAVRLSGLSTQVKLLAQEVSILRAELAAAKDRDDGEATREPAA